MRAFDHNFSTSPDDSVYYSNPDNFSQSLNDSIDVLHLATTTNKNSVSLALNLSAATLNVNNVTTSNMNLLNSFGGIIHDELTETSYLGLNILTNLIFNVNIEVCGQAAAKINSILYNRPVYNMEEAGYLIYNIEKVMFERFQDPIYEEHYVSLIPIMKNLVNKCYHLLQMNVQIPNVPFNNVSATPYEDFKDYCKTNEWRIFIQKQINPLRDQYLAMAINPCQMNMKLWWTVCKDMLMQSIHKRNRQLGESKIKFEDSIFNKWKEAEKQETIRYQNFLIHLKRSNLAMRKQLHNSLRFFASNRGAWNEGKKDMYWMLSNNENRERMRCKLVENLQFDSHFEASRLRDYSDYTYFNYEKLAEKRILSYADTLITAMNERLETGGLQPGVPEPHPCSLRTSQISSDELKNDYLDLANCCQRHVCRLDGYCKSRKKGKENECRFGYPFKIEPVSRIEFSETENSVKANVICMRNDPYMNRHTWRANVDMQLILDHHAGVSSTTW